MFQYLTYSSGELKRIFGYSLNIPSVAVPILFHPPKLKKHRHYVLHYVTYITKTMLTYIRPSIYCLFSVVSSSGLADHCGLKQLSREAYILQLVYDYAKNNIQC